MRERERLEDFQGGHVACRLCKRLLYFDPETLRQGHQPMLCCGIAYVPMRPQVDLLIYDKLQPGDFADATEIPPLTPTILIPHYPDIEDMPERDNAAALAFLDTHEIPALPDDEPFPGMEDEESSPTEDAELETLVVTPAQAQARRAERMAAIKRRGRIDYG